MSERARMAAVVVGALWLLALFPARGIAQSIDLRGAWKPDRYVLKDGPTHPVDGLLVFTEKDWLVLFFVTADDEPKRGSAEGGTYTLEGDRLELTHLYHLSTGQALPGLAESPLRMVVRRATGAPEEPCRVEIEGDRMTLHFGPSGNGMSFVRSSGL